MATTALLPVVDYDAALAAIYSRADFEKTPVPYTERTFRLDRMRALLELLGHPEQHYTTFHVAGSKGKGSSCALLASILTGAGADVGLFTSPHLSCLEERLSVNGQLPSSDEVVQLVAETLAAERKLAGGRLTFFELMTAMALLHFTKRRVHAAVIEVGLGGRLDATNAIAADFSAISSLSYDHTHLLGNRLADIAREKAGIIKGAPTVLGPEPLADRTVLRDAVLSVEHVPERIWQVGDDIKVYYHGPSSVTGTARVDITTPYHHFDSLELPLWGRHQARNAALAVGMADLFRSLSAGQAEARVLPSDEAIRRGVAEVTCPARIEFFPGEPPVILDACHNVASARALIEAVTERLPHASWSLVLGMSSDKDAVGICRVFSSHCQRVYLTCAENSRSLPVDKLVTAAAKAQWDACVEEHAPDALARARRETPPGEVVVVAGSFYLAGELRPRIIRSTQW